MPPPPVPSDLTRLGRVAGLGLALASGAGAALVAWRLRRLRGMALLPGHPGFYIYQLIAPPGRGLADNEVPLELVVFGDSTAAGVGVDRAEDSMPVQLAERIAADRDRGVRVLSYGWAGARAVDVVSDQLLRARHPLRPHLPDSRPPLPDADIVAVSIGANDVIRATSPRAFRLAMRRLLAAIHESAPRAEIVVIGIPRFRGALPGHEPLIMLGDLLGGLLRRVQRAETAAAGAIYVDLAHELRGRLDPRTASLASDAFHPGPAIYRAWAEVSAEVLEAARREVR
ncbi:MAG: GDSL-type esterase/lipase family protein [Chloroflexota bacterium]